MGKYTAPIRVVLIIAAISSASVARAQTVKVFVSSKAGDRIATKPDLQFTSAMSASDPTFQINDAVKYQKIDGFGAQSWKPG